MTEIVRLNDSSDHGGFMTSASGHFKVNGIMVCVNIDQHTCPIPGHGTTSVTSSSTLKSNGKSVIHVGDKAGCGATIISGSPNTTGTS
jgi:uncharacterized Zn-binding protein involved in type VI secretion